MAACKMIRDHGLLVVTADELVTIVQPPHHGAGNGAGIGGEPADAPDERPRRKGRKGRAARPAQGARPRPIAEVASSAASEIVGGWVSDLFGNGGRRG